ncbi:MAG: DUF5668 domain-containing protein [Bacteroidales bacterium]|nr:DUF5668 domain-containing protein [Bacteroidales bacterium]
MDSNFQVKHHHKHGLTFSIILIAVGTLFLSVNTGFLPTLYKPLFTSWPIWCIFAGCYLLLDKSFFSAIVLLTVGTFFILPQIGTANPALNIPENFTQLYWPALLIVAGIYFAFARLVKPNHACCRKMHGRFTADGYNSKWQNEDGFVHISSAFDSRKNIVLDPVFKGGDIESSFGEVILDLRKTTLSEGKTKLNVLINFGSVVIIVPDGWKVKLCGDAFFGTFSDNRLTQSFNPEDGRILIIDGKCSFGECKLRD